MSTNTNTCPLPRISVKPPIRRPLKPLKKPIRRNAPVISYSLPICPTTLLKHKQQHSQRLLYLRSLKNSGRRVAFRVSGATTPPRTNDSFVVSVSNRVSSNSSAVAKDSASTFRDSLLLSVKRRILSSIPSWIRSFTTVRRGLNVHVIPDAVGTTVLSRTLTSLVRGLTGLPPRKGNEPILLILLSPLRIDLVKVSPHAGIWKMSSYLLKLDT